MTTPVNATALDQIFRLARTHSQWLDKAVPEALLHQAWDLARMAPTAANTLPMRVAFVSSPEAKARLKPALAAGNVDKTMSAPTTAIIAHDLEFYENLPKTFPHADARSWFVGNDEAIQSTAFRNGSLQGAYLMLALRSLGLDCGPMSGFDNALVDQTFFAGTAVKSNFLVNIGYGDPAALYPRSPRLEFAETCQIL